MFTLKNNNNNKISEYGSSCYSRIFKEGDGIYINQWAERKF